MKENDPIAQARVQWLRHGWSESADGMCLVLELLRAHRIFSDRADRVLRPLGLTFARYKALMKLSFSSEGAMPVGRLGACLQVHPTSVTNTIDRLEGDGMVRRVPGDSDKRIVIVRITAKGRDVAAKATGVLNAQVFEDVGLSARESALLWGVLRSIRASEGDFHRS